MNPTIEPLAEFEAPTPPG